MLGSPPRRPHSVRAIDEIGSQGRNTGLHSYVKSSARMWPSSAFWDWHAGGAPCHRFTLGSQKQSVPNAVNACVAAGNRSSASEDLKTFPCFPAVGVGVVVHSRSAIEDEDRTGVAGVARPAVSWNSGACESIPAPLHVVAHA